MVLMLRGSIEFFVNVTISVRAPMPDKENPIDMATLIATFAASVIGGYALGTLMIALIPNPFQILGLLIYLIIG